MTKKTPDFSKYEKNWINPTLEVVHYDDIRKEKYKDPERLRIIYVEEIVRTRKNDDTDIKYIKGVNCHWIDDIGVYQQGLLFTRELIPLDIALQGREVVEQWREYINSKE